MDTTTCRLDM